jgi:hypothetical protein
VLLGLKGDYAQHSVDGRCGPQPKVWRPSMTERTPGGFGAVVGRFPVRMTQELAELGEAGRGHQIVYFPDGRECAVPMAGHLPGQFDADPMLASWAQITNQGTSRATTSP